MSVITIDGPSGSGKSTVARGLARRLGFAFLDSGAVYRAATWLVLSRGIDLGNMDSVIHALDGSDFRLRESPDGMLVFVNSENISDRIRSREISNHVFLLADRARVRGWAVRVQRQYAEGKSIVTEGRDMGTVVFPDAELKVYLHASPEVRALRRQRELETRGERVDLLAIQEEMRQRDEKDSRRPISPLRVPEGAFVLDTSGLAIDETVDVLYREALRRGLGPCP